jgi:hypothetical protein
MEEGVKRWPECQFFFCSNPGKPAMIDGAVGARAPPLESTSASSIVSGFSPVDVIPPEVPPLFFSLGFLSWLELTHDTRHDMARHTHMARHTRQVWALVFEFLTLRDLQRSAALVCRAWRAVATDQCTVARLFWRHYHCDRQRRDRQRPTSRYTDSQLRNRASGASALPSPPEIIHLHFGQAGVYRVCCVRVSCRVACVVSHRCVCARTHAHDTRRV